MPADRGEQPARLANSLPFRAERKPRRHQHCLSPGICGNLSRHDRRTRLPQEIRRDRAVHIPNDPIRDDADFNQLMDNIRAQMFRAVDEVMTCEPDYLIMGMSSETFWDGLEGSRKLQQRVEARAGVKVSMGSDAARAALQCCGAKRIGVITPYMPVGDAQVRRFFGDCGFEVVRLKGLKCASPVLIAHVPERELRDAILEVNGPDVDAVIQVGTNLAMARLAGIAEFWLDKPVLAINTCIYWWSLRQNGIDDKIEGFGSLLLEH
jgi:maleate isomerase